MILSSSIKMSFQNLRANKTRSFLTMLGIIIGISSVIIVLSVGAGAESLIVNQIQSVGSNLIGILPGGGGDEGPPAAVMGIVITTLTNEDKQAIENQVPNINAVSSYVSTIETATWQNQKTSVNIQGVSSDYPTVTDSNIQSGFFFTKDQEKSRENVIVIGSQIASDLFNYSDPIGQSIKIKKERFRVIGVMEPKGVVSFQNVDNMVFIPVTTAQKKLLGIDHVGFIRAKVIDETKIDETVEQIEFLLRDRHNIDDPIKDDFTVNSLASALDLLTTVTGALKLFLTAIAAISLLVGGIGIMNIMLAAVIERIREIGLKKALGAKKRHIIEQFLIETTTITLFGATIGIAFGISFSFLVSVIVNYLNYDWDFIISISSVVISVVAGLSIGLLFGIYPARKAAKLNPIEALRYE